MRGFLAVFVAILVVGASAEVDTDKEKAKKGMLKIMNLGFGLLDSVRKSVDNQAYRLGENMGSHIADDQENEKHSVKTKLEAAREGMKDSVRGATSLLQEGVNEARGIADDEGVRQSLKDIAKPIVENPQFGYFSKMIEEGLQKGQEMFGKTLTNLKQNMPNEQGRNFLGNLQKSFDDGAKTEQERQIKKVTEHQTDGLSAAQHEDILQGKANKLIEKTTSLAEVALDKVPETVEEATQAAEAAQEA